jgi:hypothetical protein
MLDHPPAPDALLAPLRRALRPLVRLLIRSGVTYPVLADLLRKLYVEVAQQGLPPADPGRSDSRISLRTGVHRKEIRRLRLEPETPVDETPAVVTRSSRIIASWIGTEPWIDAAGTPLPLPRQALGGQASFEALVTTVTSDVRPRAVLDEWLALGLVRLDADDRVVLNVGAFVPAPGQEAQLYYFGRNLHDHIAAAAANVSAKAAAPFIERSVHYDRLPPVIAAQLEARARKEGQALLQRLNRVALELLGPEGAPPEPPTRRVNLGVYLYVEDDESENKA